METKYRYPRDYTIGQARKIYDLVGLNRFTITSINKQMELTNDDIYHISMFNLIETNNSGGWGRSYWLSKNPYDVIL